MLHGTEFCLKNQHWQSHNSKVVYVKKKRDEGRWRHMKNRYESKPMVWGVVAGTESQHTLAWYFHRRLEKPLKLEEGEFLSRPETVHQPAHSPHLKTLLVQRKSAHHSHSRAWGQTRLVALRWNTTHHKAACKQNMLFTGRLFSSLSMH